MNEHLVVVIVIMLALVIGFAGFILVSILVAVAKGIQAGETTVEVNIANLIQLKIHLRDIKGSNQKKKIKKG